jgi:hypothetical protein
VKTARPVRESDTGETTQGNLSTAPRVDSHWADGGETSVNNGVLLCRHHHTLIHQSEWDVAMVHGMPTFYPPRWLDENRKPRRNLIHAA